MSRVESGLAGGLRAVLPDLGCDGLHLGCHFIGVLAVSFPHDHCGLQALSMWASVGLYAAMEGPWVTQDRDGVGNGDR